MIYAKPRSVTDINDCYFYHTIQPPGHELIQGTWDLRGDVDEYLGSVDFSGKRVLEIGTANGFLCFDIERRGADVVAFDLSDEMWDIVPFAHYDWRSIVNERRQHIRKLNNGYWYCHRLYGSSAKVVYGTAYQIPDPVGEVDIATYGSVLLHLRDPFGALESGLRLVGRPSS